MFSPVINVNRLARFSLAFLLIFTFVGFSPFSVADYSVRELADSGYSNIARQMVFVFLFFISIVCFNRRFLVNFKKCWPLFLLLFWCFVSVFWSEHFFISIRRALLLIMTVFCVFIFVSVLEFDQVLSVVSNVLVLLIAISLVAIPFVPGAVHTGAELLDLSLEGSWKGVFIHKNHAGPILVFSIFLFFYNYRLALGYERVFWLFGVSLSLLFLVFSNSKTSMLLLFPCFIFGYALSGFACCGKYKKIISSVFFSLLVLILLLSPLIYDWFLSILENPRAFTGRATIWELVYFLILDNFWLGVGFGAVWSVGDNMQLVDYATGWVDWVFTLTHAHNGYLEIFASTGVIGLSICVIALIILPFIKIISGKVEDRNFCFLFLSMFVFYIVHNFVEVDYLNAVDGRWIIFLVLYFSLYLKNNYSGLNFIVVKEVEYE